MASEKYLDEELFAAFPHWRPFACTHIDEEGCEYAVIKVPTPAEAATEHGLVVETADGEITVSFDYYHAHFCRFAEHDGQIGIEGAAAFINDLMSERISIVSWWSNETWRGSAQLEAGATLLSPAWLKRGTYNRFRIRSWKGTFNVDSDVTR